MRYLKITMKSDHHKWRKVNLIQKKIPLGTSGIIFHISSLSPYIFQRKETFRCNMLFSSFITTKLCINNYHLLSILYISSQCMFERILTLSLSSIAAFLDSRKLLVVWLRSKLKRNQGRNSTTVQRRYSNSHNFDMWFNLIEICQNILIWKYV